MDDRRFDELTQALATRGGRRGFVLGLAGAVAGLVTTGRAGAACPAEQVFRRGMGCVCKTTSRPPGAGGCPCPSGKARCNGICTSSPCSDPGGSGTTCLTDDDCDDGIDCTVDSCVSGRCRHTADDGRCPADGPCVRGVCNRSTGCVLANVNSGRPCQPDSDDRCLVGVCDGAGSCLAEPVTCPASNECQLPGACNPATGACGAPTNTPDGTACADGAGECCRGACLVGESCRTCETTNVLDCTALDGPCAVGVCDPIAGCRAEAIREGLTCGGPNPATGNCLSGGVCAGGVCTGGFTTGCGFVTDQCSSSICDPVVGCVPFPLSGIPCTRGQCIQESSSTCQDGVCVGGFGVPNGLSPVGPGECPGAQLCSYGVCRDCVLPGTLMFGSSCAEVGDQCCGGCEEIDAGTQRCLA
jgi:hypothetical protein